MAPYPTADEIRDIFHPLSQHGQQSRWLDDSVMDDVHWTILAHCPMQGVYTNKQHFRSSTLEVLTKQILTEPLRLQVRHVTGGGDSPWAAVELEAIDAVCRNGLKYDQTYCWVVRFNDQRKIAEVRAYLDSDLLTRSIAENQNK